MTGPVVGLDIDGTLGIYHLHLWRFAQEWVGSQLRHPSAYRGGSLAAYWGISDAVYRAMKRAYRLGGMKRSMPVYDGAQALTQAMRARGVQVVLCTSRPADIETVRTDTEEWCRRSRLYYDDMIFGDLKYRGLHELAGPGRVVGVVEDLPEMYAQAEDLGMNPILIERPYNIGYPAHRVETLRQAHMLLNHRIDSYLEANRV